MSFCNLPTSQVAALVFIKAILSSPTAPQQVKDLVTTHDWHTLAVAAALSNAGNAVPTEGDFAAVAALSPGLQNANFVLAMVDASATADAKQKLQDALATHCWDRVAGAMVGAMTTSGIQFSGDDLHHAYAPGDTAACSGPSDLEVAVGTLVQSGELVGTFFSQSLPDFCRSGFGAVSGFFTGSFAGFFSNVGNQIGDGFREVGSAVESTLEQIGEKLNPSHW